MRAPKSALPVVVEALAWSPGGIPVLRGIDLVLTEGPPSLIIGPNGAGKSVLLRMLHRLLTPDAGRIIWAQPPRDAMVFQRPVMLRRSVLANVAYPLALAGVPRGDRLRLAQAALDRMGLGPLAARAARRLSGGEQQRVALARAAALSPAVLFLDEPTAHLDPAATRAVEAIVADLAAAGTKIVMTSHDLGQARRLAGDVVLLHRGRVVEHAPAADFFTRPATAEAASFLRGDLLW